MKICNDMVLLYFYIVPCIVSAILYAIISMTLKPNKIGDLFHCFYFIPVMNIIACFILIIMSGCFLLDWIGKISIRRKSNDE